MRIDSGSLTSIGKVIFFKSKRERESCEFSEEKIHSFHLAVVEGLFDAKSQVESWLRSF